MRLAAFLALAGLLLVPGALDARQHHPARGHRILPAAAALDGFTQAAGAYSFRKLKSNYGGSAVKLRRVTPSAVQDIGFTAAGDFDAAAATAFCAATTCSIETFYDQSGNGLDMIGSTNPAYVANCIGLKPCMRVSAAGQRVVTPGNVTATTGKVSLSAVATRDSGAGYCTLMMHAGGTNLFTNAAPNQWAFTDNTASAYLVPAATDAAWHTVQAVVNGASSVVSIDGTDTTGTLVNSAKTGQIQVLLGPAATVCSQTEAIFWNDYALTAAERTALTANQRNYWLPYSLDAFAAPAGAYSMRKLKSTYTGPGIRIRRASDNAETDINFLGYVPGLGSPLDTAAATAHCAATACYVRTVYNQGGAGTRHLEMTAASAQPQLILNCIGYNPCLRFDADDYMLSSTSFTPTTGVMSLAGVAKRTFAQNNVIILQHGGGSGNILAFATGTANITLASGASLAKAAAENTWHSAVGVINGASSSLTVDGTAAVTGSLTNTTTAGTPIMGSGGSTNDWAEAIAWDAVALTASEVAAIGNNQRSFWGF